MMSGICFEILQAKGKKEKKKGPDEPITAES